jgi:indole-3-glycerol phosphate synthase
VFDTIGTTPLIDTVPDILARIVAKKREDLARTAPPLEVWEREAEVRLASRRDFRAALAARSPAIIAEIRRLRQAGVFSPTISTRPASRANTRPAGRCAQRTHRRAVLQGCLADLQGARAAVSLPFCARILRSTLHRFLRLRRAARMRSY